MRLLLDTQIVLWQEEGQLERIGRGADAIATAEELVVSAVSFAEIAIKASVGKLRLPKDLRKQVFDSGARILNLTPEHGLGVAQLPLHHRDPFDRLLISQALSEGLTIVSADRAFAKYDVPLVAAGS